MILNDRTLILDCQVFQSPAWDRGMGKYSLNLISSLSKNPDFIYKKIYLLFNKSVDTDSAIIDTILGAVPCAEPVYLDFLPADMTTWTSIAPKVSRNQQTVDKFTKSLKTPESKIDFFILSLFIDQFCICFPSSSEVRKILLFYDTIPLLFEDRYKYSPNYENYLRRFKTVFEADLVLTISQSAADDLAVYLGITNETTRNINGAPVERAKITPSIPKLSPSQFILMPTGDDFRKNNIRAAEAFTHYVNRIDDENTVLVCTSHFGKETKDQMLAICDRCVFTGSIDESELTWYYKNAKSVLFVSEYEGLGLPILEAMEFGKPIVASNIPVFREMAPTALYYSDPTDSLSIADALVSAHNLEGWARKKSNYHEILAKYSWKKVAESTISSLNSDLDNKPSTKLRLAIVAPSPAGYSAVARMVTLQHHTLSRYFKIDYYLENGIDILSLPSVRKNILDFIASTTDAAQFTRKEYASYDMVVYHIGNGEYHVRSAVASLAMPGITIMHDTYLKDLFDNCLSRGGFLSNNRLNAERLLEAKLPNAGSDEVGYITSIINNQLSVISHSHHSKKNIESSVVEKDISVNYFPFPTATPENFPVRFTNRFRIGLAGIIHPTKGIELVRNIVSCGKFNDDVTVHIFGLSMISPEQRFELESLPNVHISTDLTDYRFQSALAELDVLVNVRTEYHGETSMSTIEAMRYGVVPIVKDVGWFSELPDSSSVKVKAPEDIIPNLVKLYKNKKLLSKMQLNAYETIKTSNKICDYSKNIYRLVRELSRNNSSKNSKIHQAVIDKLPTPSIIDLL